MGAYCPHPPYVVDVCGAFPLGILSACRKAHDHGSARAMGKCALHGFSEFLMWLFSHMSVPHQGGCPVGTGVVFLFGGDDCNHKRQ